MSKAILISREDLVRHTPISGNLDFDKVIQYIEIAQDIHIHELLGSRLYNELMSQILSDTLTVDNEYLIQTHIRPTLSQYSFLEFLPFSQYSIGNKGVFKHSSESATSLSQTDMNIMTEATRDTAQHYAKRLVDYIKAYPSKYPSYFTNNRDEVRPVRKVDFGGWYL